MKLVTLTIVIILLILLFISMKKSKRENSNKRRPRASLTSGQLPISKERAMELRQIRPNNFTSPHKVSTKIRSKTIRNDIWN